MELSRPEASLFLGTLRELSGSSFPSDTLGTVRPNPCLFPRLSVGSAAEFGKIMQIVTNDLWNAAGTEGIEEEFALLMIPPCSMSPKFLKFLKRGYENASRGSLAHPPLASICA